MYLYALYCRIFLYLLDIMQQQEPPNMYGGATSAPPPTPSTLSSNHLAASAASADALSRLLHRLPPTLSLPTRRSPSAARPPLISLSDPNPSDHLLSPFSQLGYFQLINHNISSELARSAELDSLSLFELEKDQKESYFPKNWPLGFEVDDEEEGEGSGECFCLESACSGESTQLGLTSLRNFTRDMEKVGLKIVEMLASAVGFENPLGDDPTRFCSLIWISKSQHGAKPDVSGGLYPYIVGLQYQIRQQKFSLLADSGSVAVSPEVDSILVTLGDIAQVWSNGKVKKVRGRPVACSGDGINNNSACITMSLLITLPMDSSVAPLIPKLHNNDEVTEEENNIEGENHGGLRKEERLFDSFAFEDYAWRVYHERILFKDPLDRYRT